MFSRPKKQQMWSKRLR